MLEIILPVITVAALLIASYSDLRTREVPDLVSYGLIFAALSLRLIYSLIERDWNYLFSGIFGLGAFFTLAFVLYKAHQWGGGDSKLLMGVGAVLGITLPFDRSSWNLLLFILSLLFLGAVYGLFWMAYFAIKKRKEFIPSFLAALKQHQLLQIITLAVSLIIFVFSLNYFIPLWYLSIFLIGAFYLFLFVISVESSCLFNEVHVQRLTPGDWLANKKDKRAVKMKTLLKEDIWSLRSLHAKGKAHYVTIREGIPFIPSFLFAYLAIIFGKSIWYMVWNFF